MINVHKEAEGQQSCTEYTAGNAQFLVLEKSNNEYENLYRAEYRCKQMTRRHIEQTVEIRHRSFRKQPQHRQKYQQAVPLAFFYVPAKKCARKRQKCLKKPRRVIREYSPVKPAKRHLYKVYERLSYQEEYERLASRFKRLFAVGYYYYRKEYPPLSAGILRSIPGITPAVTENISSFFHVRSMPPKSFLMHFMVKILA